MADAAPSLFSKASMLALILGFALSTVGCSNENIPTEKRPPATRQLKHIDDLQGKAAPTKKSSRKAP